MNIEKIQEHYDHAREKHPYFCDMVTRDLWTVKDIQDNLKRIRQYIEEDTARHEVEALSLLICETREFEEAMTLKNTAAAVEELYDVIAVCLRIIDVLEHRQPLGRPKEGASNGKSE
jgi:hypothetical protein